MSNKKIQETTEKKVEMVISSNEKILNSIADMNAKFEKLFTKIESVEKRFEKVEEIIKKSVSDEYTKLDARVQRKIDIVSNISQPTQSKKDESELKKNKETPLSFLQRELKDDINKYIDEYYTEDDIIKCQKSEKILACKTALTKQKKLISILYNDIIKPNKENDKKLKMLIATME